MNILHIDSSPQGSYSVSRQLTARVVERFALANPTAKVVRRDLAAAPVPHLSGPLLQAIRPTSGSAPDGAAVRDDIALTEQLLAEFLAADLFVIGAPMFNFSIPTQLKAWVDRIVQAGRTFRQTADGAVGLVSGKRAIVVSSRGGMYAGTGWEVAVDHQEAYLRAILNFLGITDLGFIRAEGINMGERKRNEALEAASQAIAMLSLSELQPRSLQSAQSS